MDKRDQSKKDEIILRQLEGIRSMTEHNLSRMGADFWGTPTPEKHGNRSHWSNRRAPTCATRN